MNQKTDILIIGAGPFGLALSAYLKSLHVDHLIVGRPMEFWRNNMPNGMFLRSAGDCSLDPTGEASIFNYLAMSGKIQTGKQPLSRTDYLEYCQWFQEHHKIECLPLYVSKLDKLKEHFRAVLENRDIIEAKRVVVAIGMGYFKNMPPELISLLPAGRFRHTADSVLFDLTAGKRVLILGGRQSALEWAALIHEAGCAEIHLVYRHETPQFSEANWKWASPLLEKMMRHPGWFRNLPQPRKDALSMRVRREDQTKVESWLGRRLMRNNIRFHPQTALRTCEERLDGALYIGLENGQSLVIDDVILATGYKVDLRRLLFLSRGNLLRNIAVSNKLPVLDEYFQSSVEGLYFTSIFAVQDFGPLLKFTAAAPVAARILGNKISKPAIQDLVR